MKKLTPFILLLTITSFLVSCGGAEEKKQTSISEEESNSDVPEADENPTYDPNRGLGKYTTVEVSEKLDVAKAESGLKAFDVKCSSCHKLSEEKLVGPGWTGVTKRRTPVWIMNFITNTDAMIDKDPAVQAQLEICLVRMPNQSLNDDEARGILEFMRKNDGIK